MRVACGGNTLKSPHTVDRRSFAAILVPTLCVGTSDWDALRRSFPGPQSDRAVRSHLRHTGE